MKKVINKSAIFSFILGILLCSGIVYGASYLATDISYTKDGKTMNVEEALNGLYDIKGGENVQEKQLKTQTVSYKTATDGTHTFVFDELSEVIGISGGSFPTPTENATQFQISSSNPLIIDGNKVTIYVQIYNTGYTRTVQLTAIGY